jgi:hypothetical protein
VKRICQKKAIACVQVQFYTYASNTKGQHNLKEEKQADTRKRERGAEEQEDLHRRVLAKRSLVTTMRMIASLLISVISVVVEAVLNKCVQ